MTCLQGKNVAVFGATGTQGAPVAERLMRREVKIRPIVRSADKAMSLAARGADVTTANLTDAAAVAKACEGVDAAFLMFSASVPDAEWLQHARNALRALREARVDRIVVTTSTVVPSARVGLSRPDAKVELLEPVRELTPNATVLSPTFFLENFSTALRSAVLAGAIPQALPEDVEVRYLSLDDQAAFVVEALDRPELAGRYLRIGGAEALTGTALAARFADALGRVVSYRAIPVEAFRVQLVPTLGETVTDSLTGMLSFAGGAGATLLSPDLAPTLSALPVTTDSVVAWATRAFR